MLENSASDKYLGDKINKQGIVASTLTAAIHKVTEILKISENPQLMGFPTSIGPISEYETKIIPKLLNKVESWLALNDS